MEILSFLSSPRREVAVVVAKARGGESMAVIGGKDILGEETLGETVPGVRLFRKTNTGRDGQYSSIVLCASRIGDYGNQRLK